MLILPISIPKALFIYQHPISTSFLQTVSDRTVNQVPRAIKVCPCNPSLQTQRSHPFQNVPINSHLHLADTGDHSLEASGLGGCPRPASTLTIATSGRSPYRNQDRNRRPVPCDNPYHNQGHNRRRIQDRSLCQVNHFSWRHR